MNCDCIDGSNVNRLLDYIFFAIGNFHFLKNLNLHFSKKDKTLLSQFPFYLEDDEHKPVVFILEDKTFNFQFSKSKVGLSGIYLNWFY